jgi:pimeloyl-ACP methyl ester carboxylesterase
MTLYSRKLPLEELNLSQLTFWNRQSAGLRVAIGSIRELLGRLRQYRNKKPPGKRLLVIVGHSFGGMIIYSAVAQSLIEAAATPPGAMSPSFADLVLLVNPAIEAARYLPVHELVDLQKAAAQQTPQDDQHPAFVCVTSSNDWATGFAFPAGNLYRLATERWKNARERQAMLNTIGHVPWMRTHDLIAVGEGDSARPALSPHADTPGVSPFWVVRAAPEVINGHSDIFRSVFLEFLAERIGLHVERA